jgi:hypothetical protein
MVAHPGLDVFILVMTCGVIVGSAARWTRRPTVVCLAGTGRRRLMAALCAEYVLKFRTDGDPSAD